MTKRLNILFGLGLMLTVAGCSSLSHTGRAEQQATQNVLPYLTANVTDTTQAETLGLSEAPGTKTVTVAAATDTTNQYANGVVLTTFKGTLYCMWQSSKTDEDADDTCVMFSQSTDEGLSWSEPTLLAAATDSAYCTSGGWLSTADTLTAFINVWPKQLEPTGGFAHYVVSTDGRRWSPLLPVRMLDGQPMQGVLEQDPYTLPGGRIVGAAHMQPGLHVTPVYTDSPTGHSGWHRAQFQTHDLGKQSRELEPSVYQQADGTLVMVFRDQKSTYRKMAALSRDKGETWTEPMVTNIPDARVKQSAGNLPDGTAFLVGNPTGSKRRSPLAVLFSTDGIRFDRGLLLRSGGNGLQPQRYPGRYKTLGYSYPKSMVWKGRLYVAYSTNKEDVEITIVPLPPA